jgi:hypothetical protein
MPRLVWTVDFGVPRGPRNVQDSNESKFRFGSCHSSLRVAGASGRVVEGSPPRSHTGQASAGAVQARIPVIDVYGGTTQGQAGGAAERSWTSSAWRECGPTVLAFLKPDGTLLVGMHDLLAYMPVYDQVVGQRKASPPTGKKLGL